MQKYDFETLVPRAGTGSSKWAAMKALNPDVPRDVVPLSVADMELKNPPEVIEGLKNYLDGAILGYAEPTPGYVDAVKSWMKRRHNWNIRQEWMVGTPGVVPGFFMAIRAFTEPGDGVILMTPVYHPFYMAAERNGRRVVRNPLIYRNGRYSIDFEDLERKAKDPRNRVLLFCSPHNPTGRVWTREELLEVGRICNANNVLVLSDEIHNDLIMPGYRHTVYATLGEEYASNCAVFTAPSKTFNLAGMQTSTLFIPNRDLFDRYAAAYQRVFPSFQLNILGYKACEIAYSQCEEWLEQLIAHIDRNRSLLADFVERNIPGVRMIRMEGTYLQWMDFNGLKIEYRELEKLMQHKAWLFLDEGYIFGEEGIGFERLNLACPTSVLEAAQKRLLQALKACIAA